MTKGKTLQVLNLPRGWSGTLECVDSPKSWFKEGSRYTVNGGIFRDEDGVNWLTTENTETTFRVVHEIPDGWQHGPLPEGVEGEVMHRVTGKKRVTVWRNVYSDWSGTNFACREEADKHADPGRIAVHRISWDVSDGGNPTIEVEPI